MRTIFGRYRRNHWKVLSLAYEHDDKENFEVVRKLQDGEYQGFLFPLLMHHFVLAHI